MRARTFLLGTAQGRYGHCGRRGDDFIRARFLASDKFLALVSADPPGGGCRMSHDRTSSHIEIGGRAAQQSWQRLATVVDHAGRRAPLGSSAGNVTAPAMIALNRGPASPSEGRGLLSIRSQLGSARSSSPTRICAATAATRGYQSSRSAARLTASGAPRCRRHRRRHKVNPGDTDVSAGCAEVFAAGNDKRLPGVIREQRSVLIPCVPIEYAVLLLNLFGPSRLDV